MKLNNTERYELMTQGEVYDELKENLGPCIYDKQTDILFPYSGYYGEDNQYLRFENFLGSTDFLIKISRTTGWYIPYLYYLEIKTVTTRNIKGYNY